MNSLPGGSEFDSSYSNYLHACVWAKICSCDYCGFSVSDYIAGIKCVKTSFSDTENDPEKKKQDFFSAPSFSPAISVDKNPSQRQTNWAGIAYQSYSFNLKGHLRVVEPTIMRGLFPLGMKCSKGD